MPGPISESYSPKGPQPLLTVAMVRELCEDTKKRWMLVIAGSDEGLQFTTWGKAADDKVYASDLSDYLSRHLCGDQPIRSYESFHEKRQAAINKERLERLQDAARFVLAQIADLPGVPGVVVQRLRKATEE